MGTYRILWTREGIEGGWYADVDAVDAPAAAWSQGVRAATADDERPPVLIGLVELPPVG